MIDKSESCPFKQAAEYQSGEDVALVRRTTKGLGYLVRLGGWNSSITRKIPNVE